MTPLHLHKKEEKRTTIIKNNKKNKHEKNKTAKSADEKILIPGKIFTKWNLHCKKRVN